MKNYLQTLQSLKILNNKDLIGNVYNDLGELYEDWGLRNKAIQYYQYTLEYKNAGPVYLKLLNKIVSLYTDIQNYSNANLYLDRLLQLYGSPGHTRDRLNVLQAMTDNYLHLGDYDKARIMQAQVLEIQENNSDTRGKLFTINKMAHIYLDMGKFEYAMKYFRGYFDKAGNKTGNMDDDEKYLYAKTKITFGLIMEEFGDKGEPDNYNKAIDDYKEGLDLFITLNKKGQTALVLYYIANVYHKQNDIKNTIANCDNAILLASSIRDYSTLMKSYDLLSQAFESLEKYKQAMQAAKLYSAYKDSVYNMQLNAKIEQIKKQSDYNSNETFIHRIEQMITEEEMSNLAITRLELQDDKNKQEIELLAKEKKLQEYAFKTEQLKNEKALNDLVLIKQKYEAEKKDREIDNLQKNHKIQALALKQQDFEQKEKERAINALEQDKQLNKLKLQKADAQRYILIVGIFLSVVVLILMIRSYLQAKRSKEKIALINAEIEENNKKLKALNEEKNRLIRIVAHDLRNPLTSALSITGLLRNAEIIIKKDYNHSLHVLRKSLLRMQEMIIKILDVKAINEDKMNLEMEAINLGKVMDHLLEINQSRISGKKIQIDANLPEIYALADHNYIFQVLENLLSNAVKFSSPGSTIHIRIDDFNDKCRVTVRDEGPGFSEHDQALMFTEYQQLSSRPTAGEKSTGLGLSIVKKYIDAMNGRIWCDSVKGQGATFTVELYKALVEA